MSRRNHDPSVESWAGFVNARMEHLGLTLLAVARAVRIDPSYVSMIRRGLYKPRREVVVRLANALDVDPDELLLRFGFAPYDRELGRVLLGGASAGDMHRLSPSLRRAIVRAVRVLGRKRTRQVAACIGAFRQAVSA